MTTTFAPVQSKFALPTDVEQAKRKDEINLIRAYFILNGLHLEEPVRYTLGNLDAPAEQIAPDDASSPEVEVSELIGSARRYVDLMIGYYVGQAGSNATTTAVQSAINLTRGRIKKELGIRGFDSEAIARAVETREEVLPKDHQDPIARALALAMVFWHEAMKWVAKEYEEKGHHPAFIGLLAALRQE